MTLENSEIYEIWALRISLAVAFIVIVISWWNKVHLPYILIRGVVSFGVMYSLLAGSLYLFKKTALSEESGDQAELPNQDDGRGGFIDASIGDDAPLPGQEPRQDLAGDSSQDFKQEFRENINQEFEADGLQADLQQDYTNGQVLGQDSGQELGQKQDPKSAGQVAPGLSEGLPDDERQAEIVRRMGWEE